MEGEGPQGGASRMLIAARTTMFLIQKDSPHRRLRWRPFFRPFLWASKERGILPYFISTPNFFALLNSSCAVYTPTGDMGYPARFRPCAIQVLQVLNR